MLPSVGPSTIAQNIANGIIGDILAIVTCEQVAPVGIAVPIVYSFSRCAKISGSVGVLLPGKDIAAIIIFPHIGKVSGLVILTGQLIQLVISIGGSFAPKVTVLILPLPWGS